MDHIELRKAQNDTAERWLVEQFGTVGAFVHGIRHANRPHGHDVASAAARIAGMLDMPPVTVLLAGHAGWHHDAARAAGDDRSSAQIAAQAMRERGRAERHIATVEKMISATEVRGLDGHRIVQAADPADPEQALLADADLAWLGVPEGPYLTLKRWLAQQRLSGRVERSSPTDGTLTEPDHEAAGRFLLFNVKLYASHRYLLEASRRLFPHQQANALEIGRMLTLYSAGCMTYSQMLADAKRHAEG